MLQVNGYAAAHGIRYGMISNILWSRVIWMDGCNNMSISKAFHYDATNPTVLQVCCCVLVCVLCVTHSGKILCSKHSVLTYIPLDVAQLCNHGYVEVRSKQSPINVQVHAFVTTSA